MLKTDFMSIVVVEGGPLSRLAQQNKNPVLLCAASTREAWAKVKMPSFF